MSTLFYCWMVALIVFGTAYSVACVSVGEVITGYYTLILPGLGVIAMLFAPRYLKNTPSTETDSNPDHAYTL